MKNSNKQVQKVSESPTIKKEFKPLPSMEKWLITAIQIKSTTITEIAGACGIDRSQWYYWLEQYGETFENWYYENYEKRMRYMRPKVDEIGWKFAERGSYQHLDLMAKRTGAIKDKPDSMTQINVSYKDYEEK